MEEIKKMLMNLPGTIKNIRLEILDVNQDIAKLQKQIKEWELKQKSAIASEVDSNGKSIYSNDAKRQGKLLEVKETDASYLHWNKLIDALSEKVKRLEINLDCLVNQQSNLRSICRIGND